MIENQDIKDDEMDFDEEAGGGLLIDVLAKMPERAIIDQTKLAEIIGVKTRTVRRMVARFQLPPPVKFEKHSVWLAGRILNHLEKLSEEAEKESEERKQKIKSYSV